MTFPRGPRPRKKAGSNSCICCCGVLFRAHRWKSLWRTMAGRQVRHLFQQFLEFVYGFKSYATNSCACQGLKKWTKNRKKWRKWGDVCSCKECEFRGPRSKRVLLTINRQSKVIWRLKGEGHLDHRTKCSASFHDLSATLMISVSYRHAVFLVSISLKYLLLKYLTSPKH